MGMTPVCVSQVVSGINQIHPGKGLNSCAGSRQALNQCWTLAIITVVAVVIVGMLLELARN